MLTAASASILAASLYLNQDNLQGMARQRQDVISAEEYMKRFDSLVTDSEGMEQIRETVIDSPTDETRGTWEIVDDRYLFFNSFFY